MPVTVLYGTLYEMFHRCVEWGTMRYSSERKLSRGWSWTVVCVCTSLQWRTLHVWKFVLAVAPGWNTSFCSLFGRAAYLSLLCVNVGCEYFQELEAP